MNTTLNWPELVKDPGAHDHFVQLYQDVDFLVQAVTSYVAEGLVRGEGAIIIARPQHAARFMEKLQPLASIGQLKVLDAEETLARFMANGMPEWTRFHQAVGGTIAEMRLGYPGVRAYGEMVDVLWQRGERDAAIRIEEYWNDLGKLQTFSLFCAYAMDALDGSAYDGALERVCNVHTHLIPSRDYTRFNDAVKEASMKVLDQPLAQILLSLAAQHRPGTQMPVGQATLFWLKQNMPRTAEKVISEVRATISPAS
jgi:DcmR-like sensory protein